MVGALRLHSSVERPFRVTAQPQRVGNGLEGRSTAAVDSGAGIRRIRLMGGSLEEQGLLLGYIPDGARAHTSFLPVRRYLPLGDVVKVDADGKDLQPVSTIDASLFLRAWSRRRDGGASSKTSSSLIPPSSLSS